MIAGALAGGALSAWIVVAVAARRRVRHVRGRLIGASDEARRADTSSVPARTMLTPSDGERPRRPSRSMARRCRESRGDRAPRTAAAGDDGLAESCDAIARALRGGHSLSVALVGAADRHGHPALVEIARAVAVGEPLPRAIAATAGRAADPDVVLVVNVLAVAAEHGGAQAEAIDRAAATLRERAALRAERLAQAASARLSTRVMTVLPFAFTGFVAATDADVRHVLFRTSIGWTCLAVGVALNLAGRSWAKRTVAA